MSPPPLTIRGRIVSTTHDLPDAVVTTSGTKFTDVSPFPDWQAAHPYSPTPTFAGTILPGLVDIHNHGGNGHGFDSTDLTDAEAAAHFHRSHGSTTLIASVVTGPAEVMIRQVAMLGDAAEAGVIAGIHAEGPFLSTARCGAQDPRFLRTPDLTLTEQLLDAANGHLRVMTLAPELPGFDAVAARLSEAGVVVALGHSDADHRVFRRALRPAGPATLITHLANGMPPLHHRSPGPVAAGLAAAATDDVTVELIADGVHVDAGFADLVFAAAPNRVALITDAMRAAGRPDGEYVLGTRRVTVESGVARLADGSLAGGTATLLECLRWTVVAVGVPLRVAVAAASAVAAGAAGLRGVGDLRAGYFADLVIVDDGLRVHSVLRHGRWLT